MASPKKKLSPVKVRQKTLTCTIYLDIQTVTCPVVFLSGNKDIYLRVCIMGQWKRTPCLPPVFPLHFNHKMAFVMRFPRVVDPAEVADLLKADTTYFELIQLVPPEGEVLATMEENSRDFLFPGLRLIYKEGAAEREILMKRSSAFPGISPKVEFGTLSVIEETDGRDGWPASPTCSLSPVRPSSTPPKKSSAKKPLPFRGHAAHSVSSKRGPEKLNVKARISNSTSNHGPITPTPSGRSPRKHKKEGQHASPRVPADSGYQQPTVSSRTRALSPYTHRKMCQLSEDARQRLSHLQLGPYHFRKENESQQPFLVSVCSNVSGMGTPSSSPPSDVTCRQCGNLTADPTDSSLLGSYRPKTTEVKSGSSRVHSSAESHSRVEAQPKSPVRVTASAPSHLTVPNSRRSLNFNHSLTERLQTSQPSPSYWEQIHDRVQRVLQTHKITWDHQVTGGL